MGTEESLYGTQAKEGEVPVSRHSGRFRVEGGFMAILDGFDRVVFQSLRVVVGFAFSGMLLTVFRSNSPRGVRSTRTVDRRDRTLPGHLVRLSQCSGSVQANRAHFRCRVPPDHGTFHSTAGQLSNCGRRLCSVRLSRLLGSQIYGRGVRTRAD